MLSKFEMFKSMIEEIEYKQSHFDAFWGYTSYDETEKAYKSLSIDIKSDVDLKEKDKNALLLMIDDKIKKMPEVAKEVERYESELLFNAQNQAKERFEQLSKLKKLRLILSKKDPRNIDFKNLNWYQIDRLYRKQK